MAHARFSHLMERVPWARLGRHKSHCKRPRASGVRGSACGLVCLAVCAALALASCSSPSGAHTGKAPSRRSAAGALLTGPYTVQGNEILGSNGKPFVPYGITVAGLSRSDWQANIFADEAQIEATARFWHGNTVRLQVAPPNLLRGHPYNRSYLAAVEEEVATAQENGLVVILSAQYENTTHQKMPNASTAQFWRLIASRYKGDLGVWFDLFNEPQLDPDQGSPSNKQATEQLYWDIWQHGGFGYVGMQSLINVIRGRGAQNVILAEGLAVAKTLAELPGHMLTGGNVAYAVHPYFSAAYWATPQAWEANWGYLTAEVPVVADEWGEFQQSGGECVPQAPTLVPAFLSYLAEHHVGLIAWSLVPGVLIRGNDLDDPTAFNSGATWRCVSSNPGPQAQGAGQLIQDFFAAHSVTF
jgi:Cellulase (glycosyl hydrolase family 5)